MTRGRTTRTLGIVGCILLLSTLGCDSLPGRPSEAGRYVQPDQVLDFETLYAQNCSGCHGADGTLGPARALRDPLYLALAPPTVLKRTLAMGVAGTPMPAFARTDGGTLTDAQIDALVKGLREHWGDATEGGLPPYSEADARAAGQPPADAARGRVAFGTFCGGCHGADGSGGDGSDAKAGGSVVDPAYLGLVSDQGLRTSVIVGRPDLGNPSFRDYVPGRAMTGQQISDVVAWLVAQRPQYPGQPYPEQSEGNR